MSTAQQPVQEAPIAVDPALREPLTTGASEASVDPVRPLGTDSLTPESRPEVSANPDTNTAAAVSSGGPKLDKSSKKEAVIQSQPINEGVLGYKAPGLVKGLIFSKKFFWFSDEPVEPNHLSEYVRAAKHDSAHHDVAHASQTGKGLLFFAKRAEDKNHPAGILNLSEVSDLSKGDFNDFSFKLHGHKHTFQSPTKTERDGWLVAIETKSAEAKTTHESIIGSEGYKNQIEKLGKPSALSGGPTAAAAATSRSASRPKKSMDGSKVHDGTLTSDNVAIGGSSSDEDKNKGKGKSRSQSRKRGSIFGALLGKKEEHDEKKEIKREEKVEEKAIKQIVKDEDKSNIVLDKEDDKLIKQEIKALKQEVIEEDKAEKADDKMIKNKIEDLKQEVIEEDKAEKADDKIIKNKIQDLKQEVTDEDTAGKEATKASKDGNAVLPGPLDVDAVVARALGEPVQETTYQPSRETSTPKAVEPIAGSSTREAVPKPTKRNSIFGSFFGKKDTASPTTKDPVQGVPGKELGPSPVSATAPQLDDPISPTSPGLTETGPTHATAAAVTEGSVPNTTTTQATTPDPTKDKRRTSFFGNLGGKKEKRTDVTSDVENVEGDGKKSTPGKFGDLFRKPSRAARTSSGNRNANNTTSSPAAVSESPKTAISDTTQAPTSTSETAATPATTVHEHRGALSEPTSTTYSQNTPVPTTA